MSDSAALSRAIEITDEILSVLNDEDLDAVTRLEACRQPFISEAFSGSLEEIDLIKANHLQRLNQQVVEKLGSFKQSVVQQHQQVRKATKATKAYEAQQPGYNSSTSFSS